MNEAISRDPLKNRHAVPMMVWFAGMLAALAVLWLLVYRAY
jgi:hypothetical protein